MPSFQTQGLLALGLSAATASAGTVSIPMSRQGLHKPLSILKRDGTIEMPVANNITLGGYFAEVEIGTPGQLIHFQIDTGSSDTWMNTVDTALCSDSYEQLVNGYCMSVFDPSESSTFEGGDEDDFHIAYLDGREIEGSYFTDSVTIGNATIENQILALAVESVRPAGIMGLGFSENVAASRPYPPLVDTMKDQGIINSRAFSLYLDDLSTSSGTVLFGGIDTQKYIGDLVFLDLLPDFQSEDVRSYNVAIDGITLTRPGSANNISVGAGDALLDSGATVCLLPDDFAQDMFEAFDVVSFPNTIPGIRFISCDWAGEDGEDYDLHFQFGNKTVVVPANEMVINAWPDDQDVFDAALTTRERRQIDGDICMFGIDSILDYGIDDGTTMLLGDTFLRSAYVVYDLDNQQLAIAQANINESGSNIVEIPESTTIPRISGVERQQTSAGPNEDSDDNDSGSGSGSGNNNQGTEDNDNNSDDQDEDNNNSNDNDNENDNDNDNDSAAGRVGHSFVAALVVAIGVAVVVF
jgi:hypothetical protein